MVIETSAILAILLGELNAQELENKIARDFVRLMSAANVLEASIVLEGRGKLNMGLQLDRWIKDVQVEIVSVDAEQIEIARDGWRQYGKGNHKAGLNFGDCFSYALSKVTGEPLLFVGNDFALTDVEAA